MGSAVSSFQIFLQSFYWDKFTSSNQKLRHTKRRFLFIDRY